MHNQSIHRHPPPPRLSFEVTKTDKRYNVETETVNTGSKHYLNSRFHPLLHFRY